MHGQRCVTTRVELNDAENCEAASRGSTEWIILLAQRAPIRDRAKDEGNSRWTRSIAVFVTQIIRD